MWVLPDVNALTIQLVGDHPGHPHVAEELMPALERERTLLIFGFLPLRIQWVLEDLGFSTVEARNAVTSLLRYPMEFVDVTPATIPRRLPDQRREELRRLRLFLRRPRPGGGHRPARHHGPGLRGAV